MAVRWSVVVLLHCLAGSVFADVLFREDFSGPASAAKGEVREGSLDYPYQAEAGGRLYLKDETEGVAFRLGPMPDQGAYYVSFSLRSLNASNKEKFAGLVFYLRGQEVFGLGNDYNSENFSFWGPDGAGVPAGEIATRVDGGIHKLVLRVQPDPDGPERIWVGLDPLCGRGEARQPDNVWRYHERELMFDEIRLRCGNSGCAWEFDELCIATDWADIAPTDDSPGSYIESLAAQASPAQGEKVADRVVRFRAAGADPEDMLPSFAMAEPLLPVGPAPASWALRPLFGRFEGKKFAYLNLPVEVDLYGTGEVTGSLLRNGRRITLFNKDNYGYGKPDQLYQSHPWVLGMRPDGSAFGVIFDTPWIAELDLSAGVLFTIPDAAPDFPVIVIEGDNPQTVMRQLANLTGRMPMPPRWALGYQQCRYSYYPDARARQIADTFRAKRIPCDVIWFDIDYMDGFRVFTFDPNHYPDPKATNDYLHAMGFKSVWMIDPGVKHDPGYFVYDGGTAADVWVKTAAGKPYIGPVWPGDCVFPDFTSSAVRLWWGDLYRDFMAKGIDGVWNDMNEPAVFNEETNGTMPLDNRHRGGRDIPPGPHAQYHNIYGMQMVKATREGIRKANPDKRPFVLSRANFLGGHRYAATWTGDNVASWEHLKWSVPMSLNLSLSGQPFNGPDIGGFVGNATPDLWAHWIAVGAYFPFCRAHTSTDTDNQEPWSFGPETEAAARTALERRYRLMPYLYTVFRQSSDEGLPVMRPVFFADPADPALRTEDEAFLVGADLMVVPRWADSVAMPAGIWQDINAAIDEKTNDAYQCGLRQRGGTILPLGPVMQSTEETSRTPSLTLVVVLDEQGEARGTLYEDAGDGYGFRQGEFRLSAFEARRDGDAVRVQCSGQDGKWTVIKRLVSVVVIDESGARHGFGDICAGVRVAGEKAL